MSSETKLHINLDGLKDLTKGMGGTYMTRVGVLGDKATRPPDKEGNNSTHLTNAEIMAIQQFGSVVDQIPARDVLLMPIESHRREIMQSMGGAAVRAAIEEGDYIKVYKLLGVICETWIQAAFETAGFGQWEPNSYITIYGGVIRIRGKIIYVKGKQSSSPLIHTGQLRRSITSDVVSKSQAKNAT